MPDPALVDDVVRTVFYQAVDSPTERKYIRGQIIRRGNEREIVVQALDEAIESGRLTETEEGLQMAEDEPRPKFPGEL